MRNKRLIPLNKLIDLEANRYLQCVMAMKRVEQIVEGEDLDALEDSGSKIAQLALKQVLDQDILQVGIDVQEEMIRPMEFEVDDADDMDQPGVAVVEAAPDDAVDDEDDDEDDDDD